MPGHVVACEASVVILRRADEHMRSRPVATDDGATLSNLVTMAIATGQPGDRRIELHAGDAELRWGLAFVGSRENVTPRQEDDSTKQCDPHVCAEAGGAVAAKSFDQ